MLLRWPIVLLDKKVKPDGFIASPAKRAAKTAKIFAEEMKVKKEGIILNLNSISPDQKFFIR
jgi:phosphohistidine phosphatase SixA